MCNHFPTVEIDGQNTPNNTQHKRGWFEKISYFIDEICCLSYSTNQIMAELSDTMCNGGMCATSSCTEQNDTQHHHNSSNDIGINNINKSGERAPENSNRSSPILCCGLGGNFSSSDRSSSSINGDMEMKQNNSLPIYIVDDEEANEALMLKPLGQPVSFERELTPDCSNPIASYEDNDNDDDEEVFEFDASEGGLDLVGSGNNNIKHRTSSATTASSSEPIDLDAQSSLTFPTIS